MIAAPVRVTRSAAETERLGAALAPALVAGDVVALLGPLGAGKTRFVAGLARGLACAARVRSPTFGLLHEYRGRVLLVHVDLYRLEGRDVDTLGLEEYADRAVVVVEWGGRLPETWWSRALHLDFEIGPGDERRLRATAEGRRGAELLTAWNALEAVAPGAPP